MCVCACVRVCVRIKRGNKAWKEKKHRKEKIRIEKDDRRNMPEYGRKTQEETKRERVGREAANWMDEAKAQQ